MIAASSYNGDRTHTHVTRLVQYGERGQMERGIEMLMHHARGSTTNCSVDVQARGLLVDLCAVLIASGIDPQGSLNGALAFHSKEIKALRKRLEKAAAGEVRDES